MRDMTPRKWLWIGTDAREIAPVARQRMRRTVRRASRHDARRQCSDAIRFYR